MPVNRHGCDADDPVAVVYRENAGLSQASEMIPYGSQPEGQDKKALPGKTGLRKVKQPLIIIRGYGFYPVSFGFN